MTTEKKPAGDQLPGEPAKKPYEPPRLEQYGDLLDISKSLSQGGKNDGAGHPNKHFTS